MSSINLEVVFEGSAVQSGTMDARLLAESLTGWSEVFSRANTIVNGEASNATVLVESNFKPGSFIADLQLIQNIADSASHLITAQKFVDATGLATLIGFAWKNKDSLIELCKSLKGEKPDNTTHIGESTEITIGQNKKTVTTTVFNLYGDSAIREGLGRLTNPLREAEIDQITVKKDGTDQTVFKKSETSYFEPRPLIVESENSPMAGEREAVLIVSKLSFKENANWTFLERGATVVAKIADVEFWQRVHQHQVTFGEGDRLLVELAWKIERKNGGKLVPSNTVIKVKEVLPQPIQLHLHGDKNIE